MVTVTSGNHSQASCASSCGRFGANSPGDRPGKFAHPRPAQRELHQQLVPGEGAGGAAGEAHTLLGVPGGIFVPSGGYLFQALPVPGHCRG